MQFNKTNDMFQSFSINNKMWATVALGIVLAGCGGGGGEDDNAQAPVRPAETVEGAYAGTLRTGTSSANAFTGLVLENGEMWTLYGTLGSSGVLAVTGFIQGPGSDRDGTYTASDVTDFSSRPLVTGSVSAQYDARAQTLRGTYSADGSTMALEGSAIGGDYRYDTPAVQASVTGNWTLATLSGDTLAIQVAPDGAITPANRGGCSFSGSLVPRVTGKNVFDVSLAFGAAFCEQADKAFYGVAVSYKLSGGPQQLILAGLDKDRKTGLAAVGSR